MLFREVAGLARLDVDDADDAILGNQRNGQLRADIGNALDVARILGNIFNQNRLPQLRCLPGDSFANLDAAALGKFRRISDLKAKTEFLRLFVEQKNGEDFVIDDLADHLGDPAHSRIQIERSREDVGDVQQQRLDRQAIRLGKDRTHRSYDISRYGSSRLRRA